MDWGPRMTGWKIEYLPALSGSPVFSDEKATLELAIDLSVDRGWERNVTRVIAVHGPDGRSISGAELEALRAKARQQQ